jgi:HEAT repeat protein
LLLAATLLAAGLGHRLLGVGQPMPAARSAENNAVAAIACPTVAVHAAPAPAAVHSHAAMRAVISDFARAGADRVPELVRVAKTADDPLVAGNALRALGRLQAACKQELFALIDDPRERVRQELVVALGESADRAATDALVHALASPDATLRRLAIHALRQCGGDASARALQAHARRGDLDSVEVALLNARVITSR